MSLICKFRARRTLLKLGFVAASLLGPTAEPCETHAANAPAVTAESVRPDLLTQVVEVFECLRRGQDTQAQAAAEPLCEALRATYGVESMQFALGRDLKCAIPKLRRHPDPIQRAFLSGWAKSTFTYWSLPGEVRDWLGPLPIDATLREATAAVAGESSQSSAQLELDRLTLAWKKSKPIGGALLEALERRLAASEGIAEEYWTAVDLVAAQWDAFRGAGPSSVERLRNAARRTRELSRNGLVVGGGDISSESGHALLLLRLRRDVFCEYQEVAEFFELLAETSSTEWPENRRLASLAWLRAAETRFMILPSDDERIAKALQGARTIAAAEPPDDVLLISVVGAEAHWHEHREEWTAAAAKHQQLADWCQTQGHRRQELLARASVGVCECEAGNESAVTRLEKLVPMVREHFGATSPEYRQVLRNCARAKGIQGKYEEAESLFAELIEMYRHADEADEAEHAKVLYRRGRMYRSQGNLELARKDFADAMDLLRRGVSTQHFMFAVIEEEWLATFR